MATHTTSSHSRSAPALPPAEAGTSAGRLLAASDVAVLLGVPRSFVYSLARQRAIPTVRLGERYVRFRREAIEAWLTDREDLGRWHS